MPEPDGLSAAAFAARLDPLGPFGPVLAVAVSGGADSMALALLTRDYVAVRGRTMLALIVDHGLRAESGAEAALAAGRLAEIGIAARVMRLEGLSHGPGLAARARSARYNILSEECRAAGIVHLLVGHHARDQAETVLTRAEGHSGVAGMAGMAAWRAMGDVCLLRPLLTVPPGLLRATLRAAGVGWSEDPSNTDTAATRARLRAELADPYGDGAVTSGLVSQAAAAAVMRSGRDVRVAAILARRVRFHPEGFAILSSEPIEPEVLSAVVQAVSGAAYGAPSRQVGRLAAAPAPATLGGVRLMPAGRLGAGQLLVVREAAAQGAAVPARPGAVWDRRFRLADVAEEADDLTLGALGSQARLVRHCSDLPDAVLQTLPAIRRQRDLVAVPHILYPDDGLEQAWRVGLCPLLPAAGGSWAGVMRVDCETANGALCWSCR